MEGLEPRQAMLDGFEGHGYAAIIRAEEKQQCVGVFYFDPELSDAIARAILDRNPSTFTGTVYDGASDRLEELQVIITYYETDHPAPRVEFTAYQRVPAPTVFHQAFP